jgi:ADP-ribosylglycohydrolase
MLNIDARCNGAFIGHAITSNYDPSISMATNLTDSLVEYRQFNGPDILSRYLYLYHTQKCEIGEATKCLYRILLKKIQSAGGQSSISRQDFLFDQSIIDESVKIVDKELSGNTAGCGPAQRSFPLALCSWIGDDDLFDLSMKEAALTHHSPLAGKVAGIVNVICRSLLKKNSWHNAVNFAFSTPRLEPAISNIHARYCRSPYPFERINIAYAPEMLNAALYYVSSSTNPKEAITKARGNDKYFCAPIIGILSGALWGIPQDMYTDKINDAQFTTIRDAANKLSSRWPSKYDSVTS